MIIVKNLSKRMKRQEVLKNISLEFHEGIIYGLSGRNGSGKTMLLRALAGLIIPTQGTVTINNRVLHEAYSFPESVGLVIESMQLLPQLTATENLNYLAKIKKIASEKDIEQTLKRVGLEEHSKTKVKKYSLGMKQRLNLAQALFENPQLLLLDEPMNAIDQEGVKEIREVLLEEKKQGKIIIIASHLKDDLEGLCDEIIEIDKGEVINEEK